MKKELNILIAAVLLWCGLIVLTPVIVPLNQIGESAANVLYKFFGVVCHQFDSRSFHIHEHPFAVCIRCTAIYFGFLISLIGIRLSSKLQLKNYNAVALLLYSATPLLLDVGFSFTPFYEMTPASRIITGSIFGMGMALLLHQTLIEIIHSVLRKKIKNYEIKTR